MTQKRGRAESIGVSIVGSKIDTKGGDIIGRDKVEYASPERLESAFRPVAEAIELVRESNKTLAKEKLQELKDETKKGDGAKDTIVAKLIEGIVDLVPTATSAVVSAFATPILGGIAGPVTKYVLDKIQGK